MPKPMLRAVQQKQEQQSQLLQAAGPKTMKKKELSEVEKMKMDRLLRQPRSKSYMEAMGKLDAGGHVHNHEKVQDIIDAIRNEFPDIEITGVMLGCVSLCYLGKPYEVHTLELGGDILTHYKEGQKLPGELEKARNIAIRGGYSFIEVYIDCCRAVSSTGDVSVIR